MSEGRDGTVDGNLRVAALRAQLRSSLWFLPAVSVVVSVVLAAVLSRVGLGEVKGIGFGGTPEGARSVLATVAGSTITVTSLTFSLTVVALQVASSQFSPRILGAFLADRGNQVVLATFLSTFAFSLVTLRGVRGATGDRAAFVPDVAVAAAMLLTALSVAMLVYFIHHLTQQLRVESILEDLQGKTLAVVRRLDDRADEDPELPEVPDGAITLRCPRSGYLQTLRPGLLLDAAIEHGVVLRLRPRLGGPCTTGTTLAWAWPVDPETTVESPAVEALQSDVNAAVHIGFERTMQQDVAFGLRQLVDIAVRALSPGVNDPATAISVIGALSPIVGELTSRQTGHEVGLDDQGRVRLGLDHPSFAELLALTCDQPRRYAGDEPAIHVALLEMLQDVAELEPHDLDAVRTQIDVTVDAARDAGLNGHELERVETMGRRARATLRQGRRVAELVDDVEEPAG